MTDGYDFRDGDLLLRRCCNGGYVMAIFEEAEGGRLVARDGTYGTPGGEDEDEDLAALLWDAREHFGDGFNKHYPESRGVFVVACTFAQRERMMEVLEARE